MNQALTLAAIVAQFQELEKGRLDRIEIVINPLTAMGRYGQFWGIIYMTTAASTGGFELP